MKQQFEQKFQIDPVGRTMAGILFAAALIALTLFSTMMLTPLTVHAEDPKTADIIVQFDDSDAAIRSIEFTTPISGYAALMLSSFDVVTTSTSLGPAVCSIEGVGCPVDNCFCESNIWWGYSYWDGTAWQGYPSGAGSSVISQTGAIEGWRWGEGGANFSPPIPTSPADETQAAAATLTWLRSVQKADDGGFGSAGASVEAALALGANKEKAIDWRANNGAPSLADYLAAQGAEFADDNAGASGKLAVALVASDTPWPSGALAPSAYYSPTIGAYSRHIGFHTWGLLGALALGDSITPEAISFLKDGIQEDGGWEWMDGFGTDSNTTSIVIQALVAAGEPVTSTEVVKGLAFLKTAQNSDGGFNYSPGSPFSTDSDANSTAYSVQALWATCENPAGLEWMNAGHSALDYLRNAQLPDGSIEWMPGTGTNLLATQQAALAWLASAFPMNGSGPICSDRVPVTKNYLPQISGE